MGKRRCAAWPCVLCALLEVNKIVKAGAARLATLCANKRLLQRDKPTSAILQHGQVNSVHGVRCVVGTVPDGESKRQILECFAEGARCFGFSARVGILLVRISRYVLKRRDPLLRNHARSFITKGERRQLSSPAAPTISW